MSENVTAQAPDKVALDNTTTSAAPAADPERRPSRISPSSLWQTIGPFAIFLALFALVAVLNPSFAGGGGLVILTTQAAPILLVALGQAMVLHVGSLDLSNAATALLSAVLSALLLAPLAGVAPVAVLAICTAIGLVNGLIFAYTQVPSFALTLGTLGILQAASLVLTNATTVYVKSNAQVLAWMFTQRLAGLPFGFWMAVILAVVLWVVLRFTSPGRGMTAVGLNETGAIFSGIRTRTLKAVAFAISGLMAGFAGLTIISQAGAASSFGLGSDLLLPGIAAAIVGGTAITGGITNPVNVIFGALTVALLPIGAAAVGVPPQAQSLVYGLVIIIVVALTISRSRSGVVK
jgi:ribose transport system permease protein